MRFIADLHIHSRYSRATSKDLSPELLSIWAQKKGISVLGTGDFTHPGWLAELREKLVRSDEGLYRLKPEREKAIRGAVPDSCRSRVSFLLSAEISCIYKRGGRTRKLHHLILMPDLDAVYRLNERLERIGNLRSDGRPILGLDSRDLLETVLEACERAFFIPAHVWTPWFSLFGSKSGFDSIEECFGDLSPHIRALETGLSSDPPMNRLLSSLDGRVLVSNSDAHSPSKLGREANLFDTEMDYEHIIRAMSDGDGLLGTVEFFPEEGKYHLDGHRKCGICLHPEKTRSLEGICPSCGKPLTVGVLHRVLDLADRSTAVLTKEFRSLIPLPEILSELLHCGASTKTVAHAYNRLITALGPELPLLMDLPIPAVEAEGGPVLAEAVRRMRQNRVVRREGYDGEYGVISLFEEGEMDLFFGQSTLFNLPRAGIAPAADTREPARRPPCKTPEESEEKHEENPTDPVLDPLNTEQREAVLYRGGHLLITAGPGTGKTTTLTHRIAYTIRSGLARPEQVLALTFTRKAAVEMGDRISRLLGLDVEVRVATFHGFCLDILKEDGLTIGLPLPFRICSEQDSREFARQIVAASGKGARLLNRFLKNIPLLKMAALEEKCPAGLAPDLLELYRGYRERLSSSAMLDLDDLEVETLRLFRESPEVCLKWSEAYPVIFVDEYQDTSLVQSAVLKSLTAAGGSLLCAIGDPDQSIYGFRGAEKTNFYRFRQDFPGAEEISLVRNYRSTQTILDCSSFILGKDRPLEGVAGPGGPILRCTCRTSAEEAEMIVEQIERLIGGTTHFSLDSGRVLSHEQGEDMGFADIAVLFRLNTIGDALEEALYRAGIPYLRSGEKPLIERYPVNILRRFLQAALAPDDPFYLGAYLELVGSLLPGKQIRGEEILRSYRFEGTLGEEIDRLLSLHGIDCESAAESEAISRLKEIGTGFSGEPGPFLDTLSLERGIDHGIPIGDRVSLMSLHAAKGLEWDAVFIVGCEEGLIPCTLFGDRDDEEEKRLFYVGITRARRRLVLSCAGRRSLNGRSLQLKPSTFLRLIPDSLSAPLERSNWRPKNRREKQLNLFG